RTDKERMETYGTCYFTDFRHHTWLKKPSWDTVTWQSIGGRNAANDEDFRNTYGPEFKLQLEVFVDGKKQEIVLDTIAQQMDVRTTKGGSEKLAFERIDMILASLQWATA